MISILTVDDSPSIVRRLLSYTLGSARYDVRLASEGEEALQIAEKTNVNLRQLKNYRFKPRLILTTESSTESNMQGKEAGATRWIVKLFDPEQLLATVREVLDKA